MHEWIRPYRTDCADNPGVNGKEVMLFADDENMMDECSRMRQPHKPQ